MSDDFDLCLIPLPPSISPPSTEEAHGLNLSQEIDIDIEEPSSIIPVPIITTEKVDEDEIDNLYKIEDLFSSQDQDQEDALNCDDKDKDKPDTDIAFDTTNCNYSDSDNSEDLRLAIVEETPLLSQIHNQIKEETINNSSSEDEEETFTQVKAKFIVGLTFEEINIQFYRDGIESGLPLDLKALFTFNYCRLCSVNFKGSDESELLARFHYKSDHHLRNTWDWLKKNNIAAPKPMREIEIINSIKAWLQNCQNTLEKDNPIIDEIPDTFESLISKFEVQKTPPKSKGHRKKTKLDKKKLTTKGKKNSPKKSPMTEFHEPEYSDHSSDSFDEFYYNSSASSCDGENQADNDGDAYNPAADPAEVIKTEKTEPQYSDNSSSIGGSIFSYSSTEKTIQTENTNRNVKDMDLDSDFDDQKSIKEKIRKTLDLDVMFQPLHCLLCEFQSTQNLVAKMHYRGKSHQGNIDKWLNSQPELLNPDNLNILWFVIADNIIKDHIKSFKIYDDPPPRNEDFSSFTKPISLKRPLSEASFVSSSCIDDFSSSFIKPNSSKRQLSEGEISFESPRNNDDVDDDFSSFTKPRPLMGLIIEPPEEACYQTNPNLQPVLNKRIKNDNYNNGGGRNNEPTIGITEKLKMFASANLTQTPIQSPSTFHEEKIGYSPSSNLSKQIVEKKAAPPPPTFTDRIPYKSQPEEFTNQRGGYRGRGRSDSRGRGDFRGRGRGDFRGRGRGRGDSRGQGYQGRQQQWSYDSKVKKGSDPIKNYYMNCSVCQVDLTSHDDADSHFSSAQHKEKMKSPHSHNSSIEN